MKKSILVLLCLFMVSTPNFSTNAKEDNLSSYRKVTITDNGYDNSSKEIVDVKLESDSVNTDLTNKGKDIAKSEATIFPTEKNKPDRNDSNSFGFGLGQVYFINADSDEDALSILEERLKEKDNFIQEYKQEQRRELEQKCKYNFEQIYTPEFEFDYKEIYVAIVPQITNELDDIKIFTEKMNDGEVEISQYYDNIRKININVVRYI